MEHLPTDIPMNTNNAIPSAYSESLSYYEEILRFRHLLINTINGFNALVDKEQMDIDNLDNLKEDKSFLTTNRKLSETGNFTGSWFGISNPVYADPGIANIVADNVARLDDYKNYTVKATWFGVSPLSGDNTTALKQALDNVKLNGGGTVELPFGVIQSQKFNWQDYITVKLKGVGRSYPGAVHTTIKLIGEYVPNSVGFQLSDTTNPTPTWKSNHCMLEGLYIDCNNRVDIGINASYGTAMKDVTVRFAVSHGIQFEDYTDRVYLDNVESAFNGGHGIYFRGKMTTQYHVMNSHFDGNNGYGIYIEGGASAKFDTCTAQANNRGGIKIYRKAGYTGSYFLSNITFNNCYTEANGTLAVDDPNYEGNYAVVISGYDKTGNVQNKPANIKFTGGGIINAGTSGNAVKIDSVFGCKFDCTVNGNWTVSNPDGLGVYGVEYATQASSASVPTVDGLAVTSYYMNYGDVAGICYNGGLFPTRGRCQTYEFFLPTLPTVTGSTPPNMNSIYNLISGITGIKEGYTMPFKGSVLGIRLEKIAGGYGGHGTVTATPVYYSGTGLNVTPPNPINSACKVTIDLTNEVTQNKAVFLPNTYKFGEGNFLGVQLTTSSDYTEGTKTGYVCQVFVEY